MLKFMKVFGFSIALSSGVALAQPTTAPTTQGSNVERSGVAAARTPIRISRPPSSGAPRGEGTAASRGGEEVPTPILFAEHDDAGLTISASPTICFYIAEPTKNKAVVTLSDPIDQTTIGVKWFPQGFPKAGVYRVQMDELRAPLKADGIYTWNVSIYSAKQNNAGNALAHALMRYQPSADLSAKIANVSAEERARVLGEAGIWYDAIAALSEAIEANPSDTFLRAQRTQLLTDRNKENAASFEQSPESR